MLLEITLFLALGESGIYVQFLSLPFLSFFQNIENSSLGEGKVR